MDEVTGLAGGDRDGLQRRKTGGDEVFRALVLARIIEPTSKLDALRVLEEAGVDSVSYRTLTRRLSSYGNPLWRKDLWRRAPRTPRWGRHPNIGMQLCHSTHRHCGRSSRFCPFTRVCPNSFCNSITRVSGH